MCSAEHVKKCFPRPMPQEHLPLGLRRPKRREQPPGLKHGTVPDCGSIGGLAEWMTQHPRRLPNSTHTITPKKMGNNGAASRDCMRADRPDCGYSLNNRFSLTSLKPPSPLYYPFALPRTKHHHFFRAWHFKILRSQQTPCPQTGWGTHPHAGGGLLHFNGAAGGFLHVQPCTIVFSPDV